MPLIPSTQPSVLAENVRTLRNQGYNEKDAIKAAAAVLQSPGTAERQPPLPKDSDWLRADGSRKGLGFFGVLNRPDGRVSSELSMGTSDVDGTEQEIPLLVPTLSHDEIQYLLAASPGDWQNPMMKAIAAKAVAFAQGRQKAGKPFFAQEGEQVPMPPRTSDIYLPPEKK